MFGKFFSFFRRDYTPVIMGEMEYYISEGYKVSSLSEDYKYSDRVIKRGSVVLYKCFKEFEICKTNGRKWTGKFKYIIVTFKNYKQNSILIVKKKIIN